MGRKVRTPSEWEEIVSAYKQSGQTMKEFSEGIGMHYKTLSNHLRPRCKAENISRSPQEWRVLVEAQKTSGINLARWCREHEISETAMRNAIRRLRAGDNISGTEVEWATLGSDFEIPASEPEEESKSSKIRIRAGNLEVETGVDYPIENLTLLLERLVKKC